MSNGPDMRGLGMVVGAVLAVAWVAAAQDQPAAPSVAQLDHAPATPQELALPLVLWPETQTEPEPLAAWLLRVDLQCLGVEIVTMPAADPDGDGPAEAALTDPLELAHRYGALAAVNANGFSGLPGPDGKADSHWRVGLPVDMAGLVVSTGVVHSLPGAPHGGALAFWFDGAGDPHMGAFTGDVHRVREGCNAWWIDLVAEGRILPKPGGDRHPRTAIGLDATGQWLLLVVVDGRQPRHSVGMTAQELAALMAKHGCRRAINLDGGGSTILLASDSDGQLQIINKPCDGKPRPLPMMLGVRRKAERSVRSIPGKGLVEPVGR